MEVFAAIPRNVKFKKSLYVLLQNIARILLDAGENRPCAAKNELGAEPGGICLRTDLLVCVAAHHEEPKQLLPVAILCQDGCH